MSLPVNAHRFGRIWCGYTLSVVVAGLAISSVMATTAVLGPSGFANSSLAGKIGGAAALTMLFAVFAIPFTLLLTFVPAALAIMYAEPHEVRSPAAYAVMGLSVSAIAFACLFVFLTWNSGGVSKLRPPPIAIWQLAFGAALVIAPGLCGGLTYWAKAGRYAGE